MSQNHPCDQVPLVSAYVLRTLPSDEAASVEAHLPSCDLCQRELASLRPVVGAFHAWPTDVLRPAPLGERLAQRIAADTGTAPVMPPARQWWEPEWEVVAPGISVKMLATDPDGHRVSMLVHLEPNTDYPPHTHAGLEELHLLDGELWIDDNKLYPGDYNMAPPGTSDKRVWSETGCTCVLITSTKDRLG